MKPARICCAFAFFFALSCLASNDSVYKTGDSFLGFQATDQHGTAFIFKPGDAKFVIFNTPGASGESPQPKDPDWFSKHRALLVVNLSRFSSFKRRIAHSRLKSKPFQVLAVDDKEVAARFPEQNGKLTVLKLDNRGGITEVRFAIPGKELQDLVSGESS
jgi:hypothetical protein